jgi:hypothetical protein
MSISVNSLLLYFKDELYKKAGLLNSAFLLVNLGYTPDKQKILD